jgi:hypothetical protein
LKAPRYLIYTRAGCELCEEMQAQLAALPAGAAHPIDVVDVDADATARIRYGHKVPVLFFAGEMVCHGHLDLEEVDKALAYHRRPV